MKKQFLTICLSAMLAAGAFAQTGLSGRVSASEITQKATLPAFISDNGEELEVVQYEITCHIKGATVITTFNEKGSQFSDRVLHFIKALKPGDTVYIDHIMAKSANDASLKEQTPIVWKIE